MGAKLKINPIQLKKKHFFMIRKAFLKFLGIRVKLKIIKVRSH